MVLRFARPFVNLVAYLTLIVSIFVQAATEYLPQARTPEDVQSQVQMIQSILPWSRYNTVQYINLQNAGLAELRRQFPDFDKWAAEKPDPITIDIQTKSQISKLTLVLNDEQFSGLKKQAFNEIADLVSENPKAGIEELKTLTVQKIGQNLLSGADSVRGLITGVLQILPPEKRGALFKAGEPAVQLQMLRELKITDEQLRSGAFQGERFGLDSKKMMVKQVFALIESKLNVHQNLLVQLGILQVLNRAKAEDLNKLVKNADNLLLASDFGFVENGENAFLLRLEADLQKQFPKEGKLVKALNQAVAAIPKQWFERKNTRVETLTPYAQVVEVHPYLGIYRGCIGGDCSTTNSPMYPFSPWEHVYYIVLPNGTFVGYISATRISAGGKSTLYLKDISGRTLSPEMLEVIIHAFGQIYPYYKVQQFSLAHHAFTDRENHFPNLQLALAKYNGRPGVSGRVVSESTAFQDTAIRNFIQRTSLFASTAGYDNPDYHPTAVIFRPQLDMSSYSVNYKVGSLSPFKPKTPRDSLVFALRMLSADEKADLSKIPGLVENEVRGVLQNLKNPNRLSLEVYYRNLAFVFNNYGIELSRSFRQDYENFFIEGHLNAQDAFTSQDATLRGDSERYFVTYCRRNKDLNMIAAYLSSWSQQLGQSKRVADLIELLQSRAEPADIALLSLFSWANFPAAKKALASEKLSAVLESTVYDYVFNQKLVLPNVRNTMQPPLSLLNYVVNNPNLYRIDQALANINPSLELLGMDINKIKDKKLAARFEELMISFPGAFQEPSVLERYVSKFEKSKYSNGDLALKLVSEFLQYRRPAQMVPYLTRILAVISKENAGNIEAALTSWVVRHALNQPTQDLHFSPAMIQLFSLYSKSKNLSEDLGSPYSEFYNRLNRARLGSFHTDLMNSMRALEHGLRGADDQGRKIGNPGAQITSNASALGMNLDEFTKDPKIKKVIESQILKSPGSFQAENLRRRAFELLAEAIVNESPEYEEGLRNLIEAREALRGTEEMRAFTRGVYQLARKGGLKAPVNTLSMLVMNDLVDKDMEFSTRLLKEMAASNDAYLQVFVAEKILEKDPQARFSVETLRRFASLLDTDEEKQLSEEMLRYSERALNILLRVRTNDEKVQKELRKTVKEEDNLPMVLKAAIAYTKNGGSIEDMKKYVRRAFKDIKEGSRSSQVRELRAEFKALIGEGESNEVRACKALF